MILLILGFCCKLEIIWAASFKADGHKIKYSELTANNEQKNINI